MATARKPDGADGAGSPSAGSTALVWQNLDIVLVVAAFLPAVAFGAPELGYYLGGGGWILTRAVEVFNKRWVGRMADPVKQLATNLFEAFARIWMLAGVIVLAAWIGERRDGLAAALVILGAYSVAFVSRLFQGALRSRAAK